MVFEIKKLFMHDNKNQTREWIKKYEVENLYKEKNIFQ